MDTTTASQPLQEVIDLLEQAERVRRAGDAARVRLLAGALTQVQDSREGPGPVSRAHGSEIAYRSLRAEIATALVLSEQTVDRELALAYSLTTHFEATLAALESGHISRQHAQVVVNEGAIVGISDDPVIVERRAAYEAQALEVAEWSTPRQLQPVARRLAEAWAEVSIDERHREARKRRFVTVTDAGDGMADLLAHIPLAEAVAIRERLTHIARTAERGQREVRSAEERANLVTAHADTAGGGARPAGGDPDAAGGGARAQGETAPPPGDDASAPGEWPGRGDRGVGVGAAVDDDSGSEPSDPGEARTRDQYRADALVEMLLESDPFALTAGCPAEAIQARVQLVAPAELVTTRPEDDAESDLIVELAGYGPIDLETARDLTANATHWEHTKVHPDTGVVLSVDGYRPSEAMRRFLGARALTCSFPGCVVPVHRCDFDHTVDAQYGGETSTENMGVLCKGHHLLKHGSEWQVEQVGGGVLRWMSPAGREHLTKPPNQTPPRRHPVLRAVSEACETRQGSTEAAGGPPGKGMNQAAERRHTSDRGTGVRFVQVEAAHPF